MGKRYIAIDLSDVLFISLQSYRFFAKISKSLRNKSGDVVFISPNEKLEEEFNYFKSVNQFRVVDSYDDLTIELTQNLVEPTKSKESASV